VPSESLPPQMIGRSEELQLLLERVGSHNTVVVGPAGVGKSTLLRTYVERYGKKHQPLVFLEGRYLTRDSDPDTLIWKQFRDNASNTRHKPLIVIDGLDECEPSSPIVRMIDESMRSINAQFLISTRPFSHQIFQTAQIGQDYSVVELSSFLESEIDQLLKRYGVKHTTEQLQFLKGLSGGNALIVSLVASQLRSGSLGWGQLESAFSEFDCSGILLPSGLPAKALQKESGIFVSDIAVTNENIWNEIKDRPETLRELPPRKFEEIVAEMLEKQGYTVELTPASKDGGFDIYVASKQALGKFMYLVECKRYTPPNKVGVHLVRALHGVVQKTQANAGMLVTTSFFTRGAKEYADETMYTLHLHDFIELKKWLKLL
jgi:Restriction endonuclease/NACHT domain